MDQVVLEEVPCDNTVGPMRADGPVHNESSEDILSNAPLKDNQFFVVPAYWSKPCLTFCALPFPKPFMK